MTPPNSAPALDPTTRKEYMRRVYSNYWLGKARGFTAYDHNLCDLVSRIAPPGGSLLEVASGTGYPIAAELGRRGFNVFGVDIAESLVRESYLQGSGILACVGDAETLPFSRGSFDATYCFHSTFFFPHLPDAIDEMIRVTRVGGAIAFDIQNAEHPAIARSYARRVDAATGTGRWLRYGKNLVKIAIRRGFPDWSSVVREVPTDWRTISSHLKLRRITNIALLGRQVDDSLQRVDDDSRVIDFRRLVYVGKR